MSFENRPGYYVNRLADIAYETRFGVHTGGHLDAAALGLGAGNHDYSAIPYLAFFAAIRHIETRGATFIDYGAGLGRAVVCAASLPFTRVIGFDLSEPLIEKAKTNLTNARHKRCPSIDLFVANATRYELPPEANVLHFFNPFRGEPLHETLLQVKRSLLRYPRSIRILYGNPWFAARLIPELLPSPWIREQEDIPWPFFPRTDPDGARYRIYRLDSRI